MQKIVFAFLMLVGAALAADKTITDRVRWHFFFMNKFYIAYVVEVLTYNLNLNCLLPLFQMINLTKTHC